MSDYLWDRTGETDAEVERLEALLGAFRHAPRPLELPAEEAPAAPRPPGSFASAWLAAAAALLLAFLVGAAALLMREARQSQEGAQREVAPASSEQARSTPESEAARRATVAGAVEQKDEKGAVGTLPRAPLRRKGVQVAVASRRQKLAPVGREGAGVNEGLTFEVMSAGGASALVENTRLMTKEQLVYALRLTGAKLRDVRQRAQGLDGSKPPPR